MKYPVGYRPRPGFVKIAVEFPEGLFTALVKMAESEEKKFSEVVVELIRDVRKTAKLVRPALCEQKDNCVWPQCYCPPRPATFKPKKETA